MTKESDGPKKKPRGSKKAEKPVVMAIAPAEPPDLLDKVELPTIGLPSRRFTPTRTSLGLPDDLTGEEWADVGRMLGSVHGALQFWIGDWLHKGKAAGYITRDHYDQAEALFGYGRNTLWNLAYVAGQVSPHIRREELPWGHHAEVAAVLGAEHQQKFLAEAVKHGWTRVQLRDAVKAVRSEPSRTTAVQRVGFEGCLIEASGRLERATEFLTAAAQDKPLPEAADATKLASAVENLKRTAQRLVELADGIARRLESRRNAG